MKRQRFIIAPGKVCTFDANNMLGCGEHGVIMVQVVEEDKSHRKLFKEKWWKVVGCGYDSSKMPKPISVPERLLSPDGTVVIRYPSNNPSVNNLDIEAVKKVANALEVLFKDRNPDRVVNCIKDIGRLKALAEKLEFYDKMRVI